MKHVENVIDTKGIHIFEFTQTDDKFDPWKELQPQWIIYFSIACFIRCILPFLTFSVMM